MALKPEDLSQETNVDIVANIYMRRKEGWLGLESW